MKRRHTLRVSAGQLPAILPGKTLAAQKRANLGYIKRMIRTAADRRSDLILFGEYANLVHRSVSSRPKDYVPDPIPGAFTRFIAREARRHRINVAIPVFGTWQGRTSSFVVFIDRKGRIADCYQKTHPTIAEQRLGMSAGNDLHTVRLDAAEVGTMTCMDIEYPEVAQVLMLRGAQILLFPHVQAGWGESDWEVRYRSRAIDTGLPVVSACFGYPPGMWKPGCMIGRSGVIGRDGAILSDAGRGIDVVTTDIDLSKGRETEFFFPFTIERTLAVQASRRPELYNDLSAPGRRDAALRKVKRRAKKSPGKR